MHASARENILRDAGVAHQVEEAKLGTVIRLEPGDVRAALGALAAGGFEQLVDLFATDTGEAIEVTYHLRDSAGLRVGLPQDHHRLRRRARERLGGLSGRPVPRARGGRASRHVACRAPEPQAPPDRGRHRAAAAQVGRHPHAPRRCSSRERRAPRRERAARAVLGAAQGAAPRAGGPRRARDRAPHPQHGPAAPVDPRRAPRAARTRRRRGPGRRGVRGLPAPRHREARREPQVPPGRHAARPRRLHRRHHHRDRVRAGHREARRHRGSREGRRGSARSPWSSTVSRATSCGSARSVWTPARWRRSST